MLLGTQSTNVPKVSVTQPILQLHRNKYLELEKEVLSNQSNASDSRGCFR